MPATDSAAAPLLPQRDVESPARPPPGDDTGRFGAPYLRWTVLYAAWILATATLPLWLPAAAPDAAARVNACVVAVLCAAWAAIALNAARNFRKLLWRPVPVPSALRVSRQRRFRHIVIVPCYLDPEDVLRACLASLRGQDDPSRLCVVVTLEAKTPELEKKKQMVRGEFGGCFGDLLVVVHTIDRAVEIAGGCSNKNFALRQAYKHMCAEAERDCLDVSAGARAAGEDAPETAWTVTTCDTDSLFHACYFSTLEASYNAENPTAGAQPKMLVWQPPLFYNWDLDKRPFFNRVTHIMRSMMMLGGLISFNLNPMSVFSYPVELGVAAGFINPRYSVDDIIAKVRWMTTTNSAVPVRILPVPCISGPTVGLTWAEEFYEWGRQLRRWIIGSSESFHYFVIHWRGRPLLSGIGWILAFSFYYGVMLCCGAVLSILASVAMPWGSYPTHGMWEWPARAMDFTPQQVGVFALVVQLCAFSVGFVIDRLAVRMLEVDDKVHPLRNLAHWISAPVVLTVYSLVAFVSILRFVVEGKGLAKHDMAGKNGIHGIDGEERATASSPHSPQSRFTDAVGCDESTPAATCASAEAAR